MRRYHGAASPVHDAPEAFDAVHAVDVGPDTEDQHMARVGVDLQGSYDRKVRTGECLIYLPVGPAASVLGQADAVKSGLPGPPDELLGGQAAVAAPAGRVYVEVE